MQDYIEQACVTLAPGFHGDKVTLAEFRKALTTFIAAGNELDKIKKALFYGKGSDIGSTLSVGSVNTDKALVLFNGYTEDSNPEHLSYEERNLAEVIVHSVLGSATESTEKVELLFRTVFGFHKFDATNMKEEIGDGLWYDAIALAVLGSDFPTEMRRNIDKLRARFPNKFTEHDAQNRDLATERRVLEAEKTSS